MDGHEVVSEPVLFEGVALTPTFLVRETSERNTFINAGEGGGKKREAEKELEGACVDERVGWSTGGRKDERG